MAVEGYNPQGVQDTYNNILSQGPMPKTSSAGMAILYNTADELIIQPKETAAGIDALNFKERAEHINQVEERVKSGNWGHKVTSMLLAAMTVGVIAMGALLLSIPEFRTAGIITMVALSAMLYPLSGLTTTITAQHLEHRKEDDCRSFMKAFFLGPFLEVYNAFTFASDYNEEYRNGMKKNFIDDMKKAQAELPKNQQPAEEELEHLAKTLKNKGILRSRTCHRLNKALDMAKEIDKLHAIQIEV